MALSPYLILGRTSHLAGASPPPPPPPIGTPLQLTGTTVPAAGLTSAYTTTADAPAGSAILVAVAEGAAALLTPTCVDSAGNTYAATTAVNGSVQTGTPAQSVTLWYCLNPVLLPSGGTITVGSTTAAARRAVSAVSVSGLLTAAALDKDIGGAGSGGTTSPSMATGVLAQANELLVWVEAILNGNADTYTPSTGFTARNGLGVLVTTLRFDYRIVAATTTTTVNPTMGTSRAAVWNVLTFKGN